jgi:hypothetical protein
LEAAGVEVLGYFIQQLQQQSAVAVARALFLMRLILRLQV